MTTPLFPAFCCKLAALGRRRLRSFRQATLAQLGQHLRGVIPDPLLVCEDEGPNSRQRDYPLRLCLECFVWQMLNPGTSCREVVRQVQTLCRLAGRKPVDEGTSAYVQARHRLPEDRMRQICLATSQAAEQRVGPCAPLQGRPVKVADSGTIQLPDTELNQSEYPQPAAQKPGCGFPVMKLALLFSLASGAILDVVRGNLHAHDLRLFRLLWDSLRRGDILLGDRAYGEYATLGGLPPRGVDVVARLHSGRKVDFRKAKSLGRNDGLFVWHRSQKKSKLFTDAQWAQLPSQITVRVLRFTATVRGFRSQSITLVTTLLDPVLYPAQELIALYARRWRMELCLRDLKTTMGLEELRCQSPEMARKELWAYLIAHNLARCVMAQAALTHEADLEQISFKGTLDALRQYSAAIARAPNDKLRRQLWDDLLLNLNRDQVPKRPGRSEPRAVKRRPKTYPFLNQPRHQFKEVPHRNKYRKNRTRNS